MLGLAWDTRPKDKGDQRWFHLYPDEKLQPGSLLHWTGRDQTWNYQCADCHTTDLKKNFDLSANTYATTWASLGVTCESCHGPGSRHAAWAKTGSALTDKSGLPDKAQMGLEAWLKATDRGKWEMNPAPARLAAPSPWLHPNSTSVPPVIRGDTPFLDMALPSLLVAGAIPCGRPDRRRGIRVRLLPSGRHAQGRCRLFELP
jgi:Cytochrome c554 and c-prime